MASKSNKKQAQRNQQVLFETHLVTLIINAISIASMIFLGRPSSKKPYIFFTLIVLSCEYMVEKFGRPRYSIDAATKGKVLISAGEDLKQEGLFELIFDIIYLSWVINILMVIFGTNWVWLLTLLVPGYLIFKFSGLVKSFLNLRKPSSSPQDSSPQQPTKSKRQTKLESRKNKVKTSRY